MSIGTGPQPNLVERERKASVVMTIVFFIIGLSVILSYNWGSPTPEFRTDAPNIILFGIVVVLAIPVHVAMVHEEKTLETRFGDAYRGYKASVPRWIPRPRKRQS